VQATEAIDVWYLVSLAGMFRQAARSGDAIDESKRAALTRMLGTDDWEDAWYQRRRAPDLFDDAKIQQVRVASVDTMEKYMWDRLSTLFPKVLPPLRLKMARGVPQFALFFAISNSNRTAINLATKIAAHILNSGR
jgi:three-Cys-motif partner protein